MEPRFGVIADGTAEPLQTKKTLHLSILTRTRTHQSSRNIQIWTQNGMYKNKRKRDVKKALGLSKLTLFVVQDRTIPISQ